MDIKSERCLREELAMRTCDYANALILLLSLLMMCLNQQVIAAPHVTSAPIMQLWPLFAMDPSIRSMEGSLDHKLDVLKGLRYAGLSTNNASVEHLETLYNSAETRGLKVYALYLGCELTTMGLKLPENFDQVCKVLGNRSTLLWIHTPGKAFPPSSRAADSIAIPAFQEIADRAARHNVKVAIYHHKDTWTESFSDAIRVARAVSRDNLGVSFNLCHALAAGEEDRIPALLRDSAPLLYMVTLNGADSGAADGGWQKLIQPLGNGTFNLLPLLNSLRAVSYSGPVGFQSYNIAGAPEEILRSSYFGWVSLLSAL